MRKLANRVLPKAFDCCAGRASNCCAADEDIIDDVVWKGDKPTIAAYGDDGNCMIDASPLSEVDASSLMPRGPVSLPCGCRYTGQWRGERREGDGLLERPDGGTYEGQVRDNLAHGY